ncbi:MAG: response regulator transcription factor [Bdellovibrionota bacterium]
MNARVLLVEDESNVGSTLSARLTEASYDTTWVRSLSDARSALKTSWDLVLLDVGLPDGSGFDFAQLARTAFPGLAILFLTAYGSEEDRVRGLELGAEDYVTKPFHLRELLLRIDNILKRTQANRKAPGEVVIGKATIYFARSEAIRDGKTVGLSPKECALLRILHDKWGEVVSRDEILDQVWSADEFPTSRTVDNFIVRLRRIVEDNAESPIWIRSVRGIGYQLRKIGAPET